MKISVCMAAIFCLTGACLATDGPREVPGQVAIDLGDGVKMKFVWIPPGEFLMGSPMHEDGRYRDEGPQRKVKISRGFWMGQCEVTQEQWKKVMGRNPSQTPAEGRSASKEAAITNPVDSVSWDDGQEFVGKLNGMKISAVFAQAATNGLAVKFRLPTEAQWEYACRAGMTTRFNTGDSDSDLDRSAWHSKSIGKLEHTYPVGQKAPNAFGLYDMHGNVSEWCQDWKGAYPSEAETDPVGPSSGSNRILRGGSWTSLARVCRSASRFSFGPAVRHYSCGLRLVVER